MQVIDVNDEAPMFQRAEFEAQVMENQGPGTTVLKVTATDRDQGAFKSAVLSLGYRFYGTSYLFGYVSVLCFIRL